MLCAQALSWYNFVSLHVKLSTVLVRRKSILATFSPHLEVIDAPLIFIFIFLSYYSLKKKTKDNNN